MNRMFSTKNLVLSGLIAAVYVVLIAIFPAFSFGQVQVRIAEVLTLLPILTPAAVPGVFIGCLISNILFGGAMIDIIFGSLATLAAAVLTYYLRKNKWLAAFPPVIINAIVVPFILQVSLGTPYWITFFYILVGQTIAVYALGIPFIIALKKYLPEKFFN